MRIGGAVLGGLVLVAAGLSGCGAGAATPSGEAGEPAARPASSTTVRPESGQRGGTSGSAAAIRRSSTGSRDPANGRETGTGSGSRRAARAAGAASGVDADGRGPGRPPSASPGRPAATSDADGRE